MNRNIYDKSRYLMVNGLIGRLQTLFHQDVIANETCSFVIKGAFKLSKLRRWLSLDAHIHIALYYVKHRWIYDGDSGIEWTDWIDRSLSTEHGSASTLETVTLPDTSLWGIGNWNFDVYCCPFNNQAVPKHYVSAYNKLYNAFYLIPNVTDYLADDYLPSAADELESSYGYRVARLPNFWNTGVPTSRLNADPTVFTETGAGSFSLVDFAQIQAEYQDDVDRDWFSRRYPDIMRQKWGSENISTEVDDLQCELLYDWSGWSSGVDIHGSDSATLGDYVGKSQMAININVPPRIFNEPGIVYAVMAVRFPSINPKECPYHMLNTITADNFLCYPEVVRSQPPIEILENDCFSDGDTDSYGKVPYANWMRYSPNRIHTDFAEATGFPLVKSSQMDTTAGHSDVAYDGGSSNWNVSDANEFFAESAELAHWNVVAKVECESRSPLPTANESLFAGATHIN